MCERDPARAILGSLSYWLFNTASNAFPPQKKKIIGNRRDISDSFGVMPENRLEPLPVR